MTRSPCIEGYNETRAVNGVSVFNSCWRGRLDYACVDSTPVETCGSIPPAAQFEGQSCAQETDGQCNLLTKNYRVPLPKSSPGGCLTEQTAYRCEEQLAGFTGQESKTYRHEVSRSWDGMADCNEIESDSSCTLTRSPCTDGYNETRIVNGLEVHSTCWGGPRYYSCSGRSDRDTCDVPAGYIFVEQTCAAQNAQGVCTLYEKTYEKG